MSPESPAERVLRLMQAEQKTRSESDLEYAKTLSEEEFRSQKWQVDVTFDERNGMIAVAVRTRTSPHRMGTTEFPCDAPYTSKDELLAAIREQEADPSVPFLPVEITRAVFQEAFPDQDETSEEWEETVERRRLLVLRERIEAEAASIGSAHLAEGAL
ncbi:hypothetical protein ACQCSV_13595 [Pseudarthrobacter sp. S3]|uniref:hypothetical protein n=1 Tax=Pseudarthrobacter sp. S3 TaxID=3418419 RepID=UPI003CEDC639